MKPIIYEKPISRQATKLTKKITIHTITKLP